MTSKNIKKKGFAQANDFFRLSKKTHKFVYHHIGIYLYKVSTLEKITYLNQTINEKSLRLEQLRALENNIDISLVLSESYPIGIDTQEDYIKVKKLLETKN